MMNTLPQSLLDTATSHILKHRSSHIDMGIRVDYKNKLFGNHVDMGISQHGVITESIIDWTKNLNLQNSETYDQISKDHENMLEPHEHEAIVKYTYNSQPIANIDHIDSALEKCKLPHELITYSGISKPNVDSGMLHTVTHMSSSTDPIVAHNFALSKTDNDGISHIAKIKQFKGQSGIYVGSNHNLTLTPIEQEFITQRNTNFRVNPIPEEVKDDSGKVTHHIWNFTRAN